MKPSLEEVNSKKKRVYHQVRVQSEDKTEDFHIREGLGFQALAPEDQSLIEFDCRKSDCGICIVRVMEGMEHLSKPGESEKDFLNAMRADDDERLACQCRIFGDVSVRVEY